jgi:outer membrane protein TolC
MRRKSRAPIALAVIVIFASPGLARAQDRPTLELSLDEAVKRALENNVDIAVARYNPQSSALGVKEVEGVYDPVVLSTLSSASRTTPAQNVFAGATKVTTETGLYNFGATQAFRTGANLRVDFNNNKTDTNSVFSTFNPSYGSSFNANLTQPLLRDFRIDSTRQQLKIAKKNREISDVQFRQTVVNTVASVKQLYYDLLYAIDNLEAQKKSLSLAQKLLDENQIRVRVGTMAPLDVVSAESEVAGREEAVIVAEATVSEAEDAIKRAIFPKNDPATWALRIVPTDRPTAEPVSLNAEAAIATALEKRTDIVAARKGIESNDVSVQYARNQLLPTLDLTASYGTTGIGGTRLERSGGPLGPITQTFPGGYGDAFSDVFAREFPTWTLSFNISYPIGNRQAEAAQARARLARDQAQASLARLEMQIAAEVRSAARAVETNFKRVESTRAARNLQLRRLDAEEKKFAAGMTTNFMVTQAQRDLAVAEVAELRAIADYRKSLITYERVQEAGGGSASGVVSVSTSGGSARTAGSTQQ